MVADSGPIGGDMSHEFIILADTGESEVFCHKDWLSVDAVPASVDYDGDLQPIVDACLASYAATDEKHDPASCPVPEAELVRTRGIEVGHIRSEEHTSELQSLMRISYAVFCLKKKIN